MFDTAAASAAAAAAAADAEAAKKKANEASDGEKTPQPNFSGCIKGRECEFQLGGRSTRVDFQIQPGVIDNEYLSAVTAHSSYFSNEVSYAMHFCAHDAHQAPMHLIPTVHCYRI